MALRIFFSLTDSHYVAAILDRKTKIIHTFCLMTKRVPVFWATESKKLLDLGYDFLRFIRIPTHHNTLHATTHHYTSLSRLICRYKLIPFQNIPDQVGFNACTCLCADVLEVAVPQLSAGMEIDKLDFSSMQGKVRLSVASFRFINLSRLATKG